jgi:hypothetical protein
MRFLVDFVVKSALIILFQVKERKNQKFHQRKPQNLKKLLMLEDRKNLHETLKLSDHIL